MTEKRKRNTSGLVPFKKGVDPRRNLKGRPRSFDQLRELAQQLANEKIGDGDVTVLQDILWKMSNDKRLMKDFLEFAYGKVPNDTNLNLRGEVTWKQFIEGNAEEKK